MSGSAPNADACARVAAQLRQLGAAMARLEADFAGRHAEQIRRMVEAIARLGRALEPVPGPPMPSIADIVQTVASGYGLKAHLLTADWRRADMIEARWVAMWIAREGAGRSLASIGAAMGRRDHTTVLHGVRAVEKRRESDATFRARTDALLARAIPTTQPTNGEP